MKNLVCLLPLVIAAACGSATSAASVAQKSVNMMLPERTLDCTLGRALNLDPTRNQTLGEIRFEGAHPFSLHLPSIPKRHSPPPDPTEPPEPVHSATRIIKDPAGLAADRDATFTRVVDMWPERVELARPINPMLSRIIIISEIDPINGTANLFMAQAADAASMDMNKVFQGKCRVKTRGSLY